MNRSALEFGRDLASAAWTVRFGEPGPATEAFQISRVTIRPFEAVVEALRAHIAGDGFRLLYEIDVHDALEHAGTVIGGARLLFFFHPALVQRLVSLDWSAMVEAPLKLVAFEQPDGSTVIRWADPAVAFGRYGGEKLRAFGQELAARAARIVEASLEAPTG